MKQRAEITFEMEETVVLREASKVSVNYCVDCKRDVLMATPQAAAFLSGVTERYVFRLIEADRLHFREEDCILVCLQSAAVINKELTQ